MTHTSREAARLHLQMSRCNIVALCTNPAKYRCDQCGRRFCEAHQYSEVKTPYPYCPKCLSRAKTI